MKYGILLLILLAGHFVKGQDIIIKNDKSEIKSKITELTEVKIKYKKWEFLDGPVYNIDKANVFMIIYANGQRELIHHSENLPVGETPVRPAVVENNPLQPNLTIPLPAKPGNIDTAINYQILKVKYKPTRFFYSMNQPGGIGFETETRIVKNSVNIGIMGLYKLNTDYIKSDEVVAAYFSLYAPINRMTGNFKNQDRGLFVFAHIGGFLENYKVPVTGDYGILSESSYNEYGVYGAFGADYIITKKVGVSFQTFEAVQTGAKAQFAAGITISF